MTNGTFVSFCAETDHLWYVIDIQTQDAGSLTITIPKGEVNLKQFDYESCYPDDLITNLGSKRIASVRQISQTDTSRTLEFTWSEPVSYIEYFGFQVISENDKRSEPTHCIGLVESGQKSAEIGPYSLTPLPNLDEVCPSFLPIVSFIHLNHTITNGTLGRMCTFSHTNLFFEIHAVDDGELILDVPKDVFVPEGLGFEVTARSTKYTSSDYMDYILRVYLPADFPSDEKIYELARTPRTQHLDVTLIGSTDMFDKYKIPFLKDDYLFKFEYYASPESILDPNTKYNPQKYTAPIKPKTNPTVIQEAHAEKECKSGFIQITRSDNSKTVCVMPATAEKLILRGWALP